MTIVLERALQNGLPQLVTGIETVEKPKCSPALRLSTPSWSRIDPPWWLVELTVRSCYGLMDNKVGCYCVLSHCNQNTYVQTAFCEGEVAAWRLEWRMTDSSGAYIHYFAIKPGDNTITVESIEIVINAFKDFYQNKGLPDSLEWNEYDI